VKVQQLYSVLLSVSLWHWYPVVLVGNIKICKCSGARLFLAQLEVDLEQIDDMLVLLRIFLDEVLYSLEYDG